MNADPPVRDRRRTLQSRVEGAAMGLERPLRRLVGSGRADPLPHAGTISVFLFFVVVLTGIYITLFFEYGFEASYDSVDDMEEHPIQRTFRAAHRYSSAALVLTTVVHAWRTFVSARFTGSRRWRWLTGLAALVLVWLAGVSGYWLIWDVRAQALGESVIGLVGETGWGAAVAVRRLVGSGAAPGAALTVIVWFIHLALTAVIGWFLWRHLRRSRLPWLPPRHWMILMGGTLVVLSLALPAGMLDPADRTRLVPDMPLDPFVLFLLPPLLSEQAQLVAGLAVGTIALGALVPWLLRDRDLSVVQIDDDACTGCQLCVVDCPYLALEMRERAEDPVRGSIAVVDSAACVGCGICIGSCSFDAMRLEGFEPVATVDAAGSDVVVACSRHLRHPAQAGESVAFVEVRCTGMMHAQSIGELVRRGAESVRVIGCSPGDCVYGTGNQLTEQRLTGERAPYLAKRWATAASSDWVPVGYLEQALDRRTDHGSADVSTLPPNYRARATAGAVVGLSLAAVGVATLAPFEGDEDGAELRVIVDHEPGRQLEGQPGPTGVAGGSTEVVVRVAGEELAREPVPTWRRTSVGVFDFDLGPGVVDLEVELVEDGVATVLFEGSTRLTEGRRFIVEAVDIPPPPGVAEGRKVFAEPRLGGCGVCHAVSSGGTGVGPSLAGVATRAETTVPGLSADQYLRQSIVDPDAWVVEGYEAGQMLPTYTERLSEIQIDALVEYLLTLEEAR